MASPSPVPVQSLADLKTEREIKKLDLEITKLNNEIAESQRSYLWRNPQVFPTVIAALGAIIGLSVGLYSNYFTTLRDKANLEKQIADNAKIAAEQDRIKAKEEIARATEARTRAQEIQDNAKRALETAQQDKSTALNARHEAEVMRREANDIVTSARTETQRANNRYLSAVQQAHHAEEENRDFERYIQSLKKPIFQGTGLPHFLYDQQSQLRHLGIRLVGQYDWSWITGRRLESLTIQLPAEKIDFSKLRTVRSSIQELAIEALGQSTIDFQALEGISSLRKLTLSVGAISGDPPAIRNLHLAQKLESLDLTVYGARLTGIEDVTSLPLLRHFSLSYDQPSSVPGIILDKVTGLSFTNARPIDPTPLSDADFMRLSNNQHLASLSLPGQIAADQWTLLSRCKRLQELRVLNTEITLPDNVTFPQVNSLLISVETSQDAVKIFKAFPHLENFAIELGEAFNQQQELVGLLRKVALTYPSLRSLTIHNYLHHGSPLQFSFPRLSALRVLRLQLNSLEKAPAVTVDLDPAKLPSLRTLVINSPALPAGQLSRLPNLETLVLNDVTTATLNDIEKLRNLHTLGLSPSAYRNFNDPPLEFPKGLVQKTLDVLPLRTLVVVDMALINGIDHVPPSVQSLDLNYHAFMPLGLNWFSEKYFSEASPDFMN